MTSDPQQPCRVTHADLPEHIERKIRGYLEAIEALFPERCSRCAHPLTAPESIRRGMGPVCRKGEPE